MNGHINGIVELGEVNDTIDNNKILENIHWKRRFFKKNPDQHVPIPKNVA
jgi:hypothetical protein